MQINLGQQNQANFKGGMLFSEAKQVTTRAIEATPAMKNLFLNSQNIVSMRPTENIHPFAFNEGYLTLIDVVGNITYAVKNCFDRCLGDWCKTQQDDCAVVDVDSGNYLA